ncbi:heparan-alpha-glucosaminide N-acetyltransferase domain-containing protein [Wenyingzhuangia sp. IMCC45467]
MRTKRLEYIDIIRSIAIIMMLEGHFMTLSLQPIFRNVENPIYDLWKFSRGITAPLFLSISGLIFTYLLLKNKTQGWHNPRVQKGFKRIGTLILFGYLLQFNLNTFFFGSRPLFTSLTQIFHVLQCIGTSLLLLIGVYLLRTYVIKIPLGIILLSLGLFVMIVSTALYEADYNNIPRFIENMLIVSKNNHLKTSVFPLFPWCGYVFLGGSLGALIVKIKDFAHHYLFPVILIFAGLTFKYVSYFILGILQHFPFFNTLKPFQYQYEPVRFCQVLTFIGVIILSHKIILFIKENIEFKTSKTLNYYFLLISFSVGCYLFTQELITVTQNLSAYLLFFTPIVITIWKLAGWNYKTFLKIGQNTLSVYVLHVIILYQGFFGFKFGIYFKDNLNPFFSISGAIVFVFFFLAYTQYEPLIIYKLKRLKVRYKVVKRKLQYRTSTI